MKISQHPPSSKPSRNLPTLPPVDPEVSRQERVDAFYSGSSFGAKALTQGMGIAVGATAGLVAGGALASLSGSSVATLFGGVAGAAGAGYLGAGWAGNLSDFAGKLGQDLDGSQPKRGEAVARNLLALSPAIAMGKWESLPLGLGATFGSGVLSYWDSQR